MKNIINILLIIGIVMGLLSSCYAKENSDISNLDNQSNVYYEFTDDMGRQVILNEKPKNVVSLFGSYSELWILSGGNLVGVTEDAVSERNLNLDKDTQVIGSVQQPNIELILQLEPDLILMTTDLKAHTELAETFEKAGLNSAYFKENTIDEYTNVLKIYTDINQNPNLYTQYGTTVKSQVNDIIAQVPIGEEKHKVLLIRSMSTKAKALKEDHMVGVMLADLGADNIASRNDSLLEELSMEAILAEDPDFIFVVTTGDIDSAIKTMENGIMTNPAWSSLSAIENGNYHILPKDLFQYKPNARWGESYEYLYEILYP